MLLKIEPSEITPFFYNNFFGFGGEASPLPLNPPMNTGGLIRGSPRRGFGGRSPPDAGEVFKFFCKKAMKKLQFRGKVFQFFDNFNDFSNF